MLLKKNIFSSLFFTSLITLFFSGCADKIVSENDMKPVIPQTVQLSKFSELQKNIFTPLCAYAGCHAGLNPQGNLDLSEGKAYSNLVNKLSVLYPSFKRVVPGNKDGSLVYRALSYNYSFQMPAAGKINQYLIDSLGVWINKGALNE
ncbi:MAG: hypothetical protein NTX22_16760 [Ignavibacteriales bacterium]|nr:hypothetical protein [Ignavibacteriales bacterium]